MMSEAIWSSIGPVIGAMRSRSNRVDVEAALAPVRLFDDDGNELRDDVLMIKHGERILCAGSAYVSARKAGFKLGPHLAPSPDDIFERRQLLRPDRPPRVQAPVAMPISAPKPNSPPSANWVEAFHMDDRAIDAVEEGLGGLLILGDDRFGVASAVGGDVIDGPVETPATIFTARIGARYSADQSASPPAPSQHEAAASSSPRSSQPSLQLRCQPWQQERATARSISKVSVAPQTETRRSLALRTISAPSRDRPRRGHRCGRRPRDGRAPAPAPSFSPRSTSALPPRGMIRSIAPSSPPSNADRAPVRV